MATSRRAALMSILAIAGPAWQAAAQPSVSVQPVPSGGSAPAPPWIAAKIEDPNDPRVQEYARQQKRRVEVERELCKLRATYFRGIRNTEIRQTGIHKLRAYDEPALYPSLLKLFAKEGMDVRGAILDMLADAKTDQGDTAIAWGAVFDQSKDYRQAAAKRLEERIKESGAAPTARVKTVIAEGLRNGNDDEMTAAANLAQTLKLYEAIPLLIAAQQGGGGGVGGGGGNEPWLAWIMVGTQTAFVSDLQPVVGDSAVGFDPTVSVITEGTVLAVSGGVVVTYRNEIHNSLVGMTSAAWGQSTAKLGFDRQAWMKWYANEFVPYMAAKKTEQPATGTDATPAQASTHP